MNCPGCSSPDSRVIDSRAHPAGTRRRRVCEGCGARFTTREVPVDLRGEWEAGRAERKQAERHARHTAPPCACGHSYMDHEHPRHRQRIALGECWDCSCRRFASSVREAA